MLAKVFLNDLNHMKDKYERREELMIRTRERAYGGSGVGLDTPKPANRDLQAREKTLAKLIDIEHEVDKLGADLTEREKAYDDIICMLSKGVYKDIIQLRYIEGYTWTIIEEMTDRSKSSVHRLHDEALREMDWLLEEKGWQVVTAGRLKECVRQNGTIQS